ncbi:MAG: helix-turn-helix transcriptional regulator [Oscillospiraceae bacterium]|nr:helix-turn-helix transcriptional regulator [Oscillospiraceae bacterium]MDE7172676.1 helix-turn-helix transcriptional regulator [Oscillospiraceae bacterium]
MQELRLGEMVRRRREELNINQDDLCEGLCDRSALSRFENGHQALSRKRVVALLQRLGLPDDRFYALLSEDELVLEAAEREARDASIALERASGEERGAAWPRFREKLAALEALGPDNPFIRQCTLSLRAVQGTEEGPYPFEERLGMLQEAIRLTVPRFDLERVGLGPYSAEELRLIKQIASTYTEAGRYEEAVRVYRMALEYLEANGQRLSQYAYLKPTYAAGCGNVLSRIGRYQEALEITEEGLLVSIESRRYHVVASLLWVQAYCRYCMGEREKCISLYRQVHYMLAATRDMARLQYLDEENKKILGIEFPD